MKRWFSCVLAAAMCLACCACTGNSASSAASATKSAVRIGMLFDTFVVERWQRDRDIFVSTAQELGAEVTVQNANGDSAEQTAQMEQMIRDGMDVIVVVPIDSAPLVPLVRQAQAEGIRVLSYDRLVLNGCTDLYVSFDNCTVGRLMGEAVARQLGPGDEVLMLCGPTTDPNTQLVTQGFTEALMGTGISVSDVFHAEDWKAEDWKAEYAAQYVREHAEEVRRVKAIMCGNDNLASLTVQALAELQLAGKLCVVAQDADLDACQRIVEGTQTMTVYKSVDKLAAAAARAAVDLALGYPVNTEKVFNDGTQDIPFICLEPVAVSADNMDEVVIASGFHLREDVYLNCPDPAQSAADANAAGAAGQSEAKK